MRLSIPVAVITVMAATNACAAHLSDMQGAVFVNNRAVSANIEVSPGDRVKAVSGSAKIVYDNGTVVQVRTGQLVLVLAPPEKAAPEPVSGSLERLEPGFLGIGGSTLGAAGLVAAGAVGGASLAIAQSGNSGKPKPLSP